MAKFLLFLFFYMLNLRILIYISILNDFPLRNISSLSVVSNLTLSMASPSRSCQAAPYRAFCFYLLFYVFVSFFLREQPFGFYGRGLGMNLKDNDVGLKINKDEELGKSRTG